MRSSSRVMSSCPSTGTVGPLQITCQPIDETNGVSTKTARPEPSAPTRYSRRRPRRRAQADEQEHERDRRDRDDPVGEQRRGRERGEEQGGGSRAHPPTS